MSSKTQALQDVASVNDFLNVAATETVSLFEHLEFEFLAITNDERGDNLDREMLKG